MEEERYVQALDVSTNSYISARREDKDAFIKYNGTYLLGSGEELVKFLLNKLSLEEIIDMNYNIWKNDAVTVEAVRLFNLNKAIHPEKKEDENKEEITLSTTVLFSPVFELNNFVLQNSYPPGVNMYANFLNTTQEQALLQTMLSLNWENNFLHWEIDNSPPMLQCFATIINAYKYYNHKIKSITAYKIDIGNGRPPLRDREEIAYLSLGGPNIMKLNNKDVLMLEGSLVVMKDIIREILPIKQETYKIPNFPDQVWTRKQKVDIVFKN